MTRYTFDGQPATMWHGCRRDRAEGPARRLCWVFLLILACAAIGRLS